MDKDQISERLSGIGASLDYVMEELLELAEKVDEGINKDRLQNKLYGLSSIVDILGDEVMEAQGATNLTQEEELGKLWGMICYPKLNSFHEDEKKQ